MILYFPPFLPFLLRIPNAGYDFSKNEGKPFHYFSYGVSCSEVEIDCLTGDHKVSRLTKQLKALLHFDVWRDIVQ